MAAMGKGSKRDTDDVTDGPTGSEQFRRLDDFSHRDRMSWHHRQREVYDVCKGELCQNGAKQW